MEIPLFIDGNMFETHTITQWQYVWDLICKMAYEGTGICEKIVTSPGILHINGEVIKDNTELRHASEYAKTSYMNTYFLTLDNIWKQYSKFYGTKMPGIVPELTEIVVPFALYNELGVNPWFRHSFPNCKVTFWEN